MTRFAYPNVRASRFAGCGRYAVFFEATPEPGYEEAIPESSTISEVMDAILMLAPESSDAKRVVYETADDPDETYRGDSLDLAYLLAAIHCHRPLRSEIAGDIWCTGSLHLEGGCPILKQVIPQGFEVKLNAFLSDENPDPLFVIPETNLRHPGISQILDRNGDVRVFSLKAFRFPGDPRKKTILKVRRNELDVLTDTLFKTPANWRKRIITAMAVIFVLTALFLGVPHVKDVPRFFQKPDKPSRPSANLHDFSAKSEAERFYRLAREHLKN